MNNDLEFIDIDLDDKSIAKNDRTDILQKKTNPNPAAYKGFEESAADLDSTEHDFEDNTDITDKIHKDDFEEENAAMDEAPENDFEEENDAMDEALEDDFEEENDFMNEALGDEHEANEKNTDSEELSEVDDKRTKGKSRMIVREILSYIFIVAAAFIIALLTNSYLIVNARIPSGSMIPTIMEGNRIIGNRLAYINSEPKRGDIVVFYYPDNEEQKFIKRIIGLPGETIYIADGIVYIDGQPLDESSYLTVETYGVSGPFTIPDDCYFVMGDNRNNSNDSRFWTNHFVHKDKIIAKALFCYYPSIHLIK